MEVVLDPSGPDEFGDHGLHANKSLLAYRDDPVRGQEEAVVSGVGKLDRERVRDAELALGPVVAAAWKRK